jgi:hypothetical protein
MSPFAGNENKRGAEVPSHRLAVTFAKSISGILGAEKRKRGEKNMKLKEKIRKHKRGSSEISSVSCSIGHIKIKIKTANNPSQG